MIPEIIVQDLFNKEIFHLNFIEIINAYKS